MVTSFIVVPGGGWVGGASPAFLHKMFIQMVRHLSGFVRYIPGWRMHE